MKQLDHIGIAVKNMEEARQRFSDILDVEFSNPETLPEQGVVVSMADVGGAWIELLEPLSPDSAVGQFIANKGEGLHHLAFLTPDLEGALEKLTDRGIELVDKQPRPGAHGTSIAFIHPRSTARVLTELVEDT